MSIIKHNTPCLYIVVDNTMRFGPSVKLLEILGFLYNKKKLIFLNIFFFYFQKKLEKIIKPQFF